jgi:hypothetical protein
VDIGWFVFGFLFVFPGGAWWIALWVMLLIAALAIPIHLFHVLGSTIERRVQRALDQREARRSPTLEG